MISPTPDLPVTTRIRRRRDHLRSIVSTLLLVAVAAAVPLTAGPEAAHASSAYDDIVDITFPVAGEATFIDDYYQPRGANGERMHKATDLMTDYGTPVHAAVGGTITFITGLDDNPPSYGYMISVAGDDGRTYNYIHLGRQDGTADEAYASGLEKGTTVARGQYLGIAGCSGNASCSWPHLHFEIVDPSITDPDGTNRMNPYASLVDARDRGDFPTPTRFTDVSSNATHATGIEWIAEQEITRGCNPPVNDRFCPRREVTRDQMAAFLSRTLELSDASGGGFADVPSGSTFERDIDRLATAGITRGCNPPTNDRFCPDRSVTRAEMAAFLARALDLEATSGGTFEDVPSGSTFAEDIDRLATAGITRGCNPPANDRFCPDSPVTREQMATFIYRGAGG